MNYRNDARRHHAAAEAELASGDVARLKYAALELRMSMEALTYDRALAFKDEFPPAEYDTWQPRKVMLVLLEIDPSADADRALAVGREVEPGAHASAMQPLGTERVLNMAALKKHYDALGSYLHIPSMRHTKQGKSVDHEKLRQKCEELLTLVGLVLASPIYNVTLGTFAKMDCFRCQHPIRKRLLTGQPEYEAVCYNCGATYVLRELENGKIEWQAKRQEVPCANNDCAEIAFLWDADLKVGKFWKCSGCSGRNVIGLCVNYEPRGA